MNASGRWNRRYVLAATGVGLTGVLLLLLVASTIVLRPPGVVSLVAIGAHYAGNLSVPHNACGWNGLKAACRLQDEDGSLRLRDKLLMKSRRNPVEADGSFSWQGVVDKLRQDVLVLVVSLHGGADDEGPYLLRSSASPGDSADRVLRISTLLSALRRLPPDQPKLIVFDASHEASLQSFGVVQNRFAEGLRALEGAISAVPNLMVVCACSPGERSWHEPAVGRTILLNTFVEGLRGAAEDVDCNGRISVHELIEYLCVTVKARAALIHHREQNVMVLPSGDVAADRLYNTEVALAKRDYLPLRAELPSVSEDSLKELTGRIDLVADSLQEPSVIAPTRWRRLGLLQLRYEQLLASGCPDLAGGIASKIAGVIDELQDVAGGLPRESDPVQLASAPEGSGLDGIVDSLLAKLLTSPVDGVRAIWEQECAGLEAPQVAEVRRELYDQLLNRFEDAPVARLKETSALIRAVSPRSAARPAEAHLLLMLAEGLPKDLDAARWNHPLRVAIRTRILSESVFPRGAVGQTLAAEVFPLLETRLSLADKLRREGEDLLFCGEPCLHRAESQLEAAAARYAALQQDAEKLREAQAVRDSGFLLLPQYSSAVAGLFTSTDDDLESLSRLRDAVEEAWTCSHQLGDLLSDTQRPVGDPAEQVRAIESCGKRLRTGLSSLRMCMQSWQSDLVERSGAAFWNNRDAVLMAPEMEPSQRLRLLSMSPPAVEKAVLDQRLMPLPSERQERWKSEELVRRARLTLAAIGRRRFDTTLHERGGYEDELEKCSCESTATYEELHTGLKHTESRLRRIERSRHSLQQRAARVVAEGEQDSWGFTVLADAADVERRSGAVSASGREPQLLRELNKVTRSRYLIKRAGRVVADGWNSESGVSKPYSQLAAEAYLTQAERLLPGRSATDRMRERAATPVVLSIDGPETAYAVGGFSPPMTVKIGGKLEGVASITARCGDGLHLVSPGSIGRTSGTFPSGDDDCQQLTIAADVPPDGGRGDAPPFLTRQLTLAAWQRGHRTTRELSVVDYRHPETWASSPPPIKMAGVTLVERESLERQLPSDGAVAFVLDASGSMGPTRKGSGSKYELAVEALASLLEDLPAGVRVSVWVFGQAVGPRRTVEAAEQTIRQVLTPVVWDPTDREVLQRLRVALAFPNVRPWNESPLGHAILAAAHDLRDVRGSRSIVAITDGLDNRIALDRVANPDGVQLGDLLVDQLAGTGVALQIIGFRVVEAEQTAAREQFAFVSSLNPPGRWWEASEVRELEQALRRSLQHNRVVQLTPSGGVSHSKPVLARVASHASPSDWQPTKLAPGVYAIETGTGHGHMQQLELQAGDLMVLSLLNGADGVEAAQAPSSPTRPGGGAVFETGGWSASLLSRRVLPDAAVSSVVAIERIRQSRQADAQVLRLSRPTQVWVESAGSALADWCWTPLYGYRTPCWDLTARGLSSGLGAEAFSLWWTTEGQCPASLTLSRQVDFQAISDLIGRSWRVGGELVTLNRLEVCRDMLPDSSGKQVEQSALVVDLGCKRPVLVAVPGVSTPGRDLRVYRKAGRCILRFWPLTKDELNAGARGLQITTVEDLKRTAESSEQTATFSDIPPASPNSPRPLPLVDWLDARAN